MLGSPFLSVPEARWLASNDLAFAFLDPFPVSSGHALVVTRRLVPSWWEATDAERQAVLALVDLVRELLGLQDPRPDGFNVGFNAGEAAGQTVMHLHVHVIPRYRGDMPDPRGGVRNVIPWRGNYLAGHSSGGALRDGPARPLAPSILDALANPRFDRVDLAVSFVMGSGLSLIDRELLETLTRRGLQLRILTTDYLGITERVALLRLLRTMQAHPGAMEVRVFRATDVSFHPKAYLFRSSTDLQLGLAFVGSANLSGGGLLRGVEWSLLTRAPGELHELSQRFEELWVDSRSVPLTEQVIAAYVESPRGRGEGDVSSSAEILAEVAAVEEPRPTEIQTEALAALDDTRAMGYGAGLVVLATGLGKTWLAAFDSSRPWARRSCSSSTGTKS